MAQRLLPHCAKRVSSRKGEALTSQVQVVRLPRPGEAPSDAKAGATSVLSLLMLAAEMGVDVELRGEGAQALAAVDALKALINRRFDEEE